MERETMAKRIADYVLIRRAREKDPEKIHRGLQQGLRIEHPERIAGYAGFFFNTGDIFASGYIAGQMKNRRFRDFVMESLKKYDKGNFGDISRQDEEENIENRYLFGIDRVFGRYGYYLTDGEEAGKEPYYEVIRIRTHDGNTWVTCESEEDWFLFLEEEHLEIIRNTKRLQEGGEPE